MAVSICSDIFTVSVVVNLDCTLEIPEAHKIKYVVGYGAHLLQVPFTYTIGTDPNPDHNDFGFTLISAEALGRYTADPTTNYPFGITVTGRFVVPPPNGDELPDLSGLSSTAKSGLVIATVTIPETVIENLTFDVRDEKLYNFLKLNAPAQLMR